MGIFEEARRGTWESVFHVPRNCSNCAASCNKKTGVLRMTAQAPAQEEDSLLQFLGRD